MVASGMTEAYNHLHLRSIRPHVLAGGTHGSCTLADVRWDGDTSAFTGLFGGSNRREHELEIRGGAKTSSSQSQNVSGPAETKDDVHMEDDGKRDSTLLRDTESTKVINESKIATEQTFACPFFKRSPLRYRLERSCSDRGWYEVARLK